MSLIRLIPQMAYPTRPRGKNVHRFPAKPQESHLFHHVLAVLAHQAHPVAGTDLTVHHPHQQHHSPEGVVLGIEDERPEWILGVAAGRRDSLHDRVENLVDPFALLGRGQHHLEGIESEFPRQSPPAPAPGRRPEGRSC